MNKFLLSVIAATIGTSAYAQDAQEWGEWEELPTSTVTFPADEFIFTGTIADAPTYFRQSASEEGRAQYRFDNVFASNVSEEKGSLVVDVYPGDMGEEVGVSAQALPAFDLAAIDPSLTEWFKGPFSVCDLATAYDMPFYRMMNEYDAEPLSMKISLVVYDDELGPMDGGICQGNLEIKTNAKPAFSIASEYIIGGDMGMGLLKVDKDESVWSIKYALEKGDADKYDPATGETYNIIDRIKADDETLGILYYMSGDIIISPMDGPGSYILGAVAYDENDNVVGSATCKVYNMPTESWNWTSLGNAKVSEDFLREVFGINLNEAGIAANGPAQYEVAVEESNATPGFYRLVNLYGPSHPYSAIFEYLNEFPVYTYIDCTNEAGCYIYNMLTGFVVKGDTSGEILLGSYISTFENAGWALSDLIDYGFDSYFGSRNENVITFKAEQVAIYVPVFAEYFGEGWVGGDMCTESDFTIELPEGNSVESLTTDEKGVYYDLNGVRVSDPVKGGIYILRKGDKVEKIIK